MIVNKFAKKCQSCGAVVKVGQGFAYNNGHGWFTVCASAACHRHLGVSVNQNINKVHKLTEDGKIYMPYDAAAIPLIRSLPGARFNPENLPKPDVYWQVSMKPEDIPRVLEIADRLQLDVPDALRNLAKQGTEESRAALARAQNPGNGKTLYKFQIEGVEFLSLHDRAFLADDMGVGKTIQALMAIPANERILVICPATLKYNWRDEIQAWRSDYRITICNGKEETAAKALAKGKDSSKIVPFKIPDPGEIVICNYDILPNYLSPQKDSGKVSRKGNPILIADLTEEQKTALEATTLIGDEFHLVKNYKTNRSQRVGQITRLCRRVWALSGTPLMNRPEDLFGVLSAGNMNIFGSWDNFLRLFNGYKNQWGGYEFGMPQPEVAERLRRIMLRRLKTDVLKDLPAKIYKEIEIDCESALTTKLNTFLGKVIGTKDYDDEDLDLDAENLPSFESFSKIRSLLAESRIPAMLEIVESYEDAGTPLVVFSAHKAPIEALADRAGWKIITGDTEVEDRRNIVREFQDGNLKGVALTIKTGGVGVTLTRATNALFVDLDWTPSWNIQAEDRLVRIGATGNSVLIMRMRSNHALDKHIYQLLSHKIELAYQALETSINFKPLPKQRSTVEVIEETDEEMMARIQEAGDRVERDIALTKLHGVLARESEKVKDVPEPKLTPGRKEMLRNALEYMIGRCDGAETRDGMGFNKPDAFMSRWIGICLREEDEISYRVLERILVRYRRQLKGKFEEIWKPEHEDIQCPKN